MRAPRSWMAYPQADFQAAHNCATASPQCELGIAECGRQTETMGFWSPNYFPLIPGAIRNSRPRRRPMLSSTARPSIRPASMGPQWFMRDFADKVEEAENTGVAASSEKAPPGVRRDKALRDEVHPDEAHRDKVGEDKIRRDKDKRKRKQAGAPTSRRGSPSGAEHHAELFAADRGGGSRSRTRIELGSGQGLARTGEMLSGGHLHTVRVRCKARDAFV